MQRIAKGVHLLGLITPLLWSSLAYPQQIQRLWTRDMATNLSFEKRLHVPELLLLTPSLEFISANRIICGFYSVALDEVTSGNTYHIQTILTDTGAFGRELDFDPADRFSVALALNGGDFAVLAGNSLSKFSSGSSLLSQRPTPRIGDDDAWMMDVPPGGTQIALYHKNGPGKQPEVLWLKSDDLSIANRTPASSGYGFWAGNMKYITNLQQQPCSGCMAWFITDELLFVDQPSWRGTKDRYFIQRSDGRKIMSGDAPGAATHFARSMAAPRIAFLEADLSSGDLLSTRYRVVQQATVQVLDWGVKKRVATIALRETRYPKSGFTQSALALSPDGKYLAVLVDDALSLYRLPE